MDNIFDSFSWHSSIGIDETLKDNKRFVTRVANNESSLRSFVASGDSKFLVHKTTKALWRVSDDKKTIEPVFPTDVLTAEQAEELMREV